MPAWHITAVTISVWMFCGSSIEIPFFFVKRCGFLVLKNPKSGENGLTV